LKVSIYHDPTGEGSGSIGGSQMVVALLAEALAKEHRVDLFHRLRGLTLAKLAAGAGVNLEGVTLRYVETGKGEGRPRSRSPLAHFAAASRHRAELSEGYDLFVAVVHDAPPFCHARRGALIVLFPTPTAPYVRPGGGVDWPLALRRLPRYLYQTWQWRRRMATYGVRTAISTFSKGWARRRWKIDCDVVHPPVDTGFGRARKEPLVLSVGRFAIEGEGHTKKQAEMLASFRELESEGHDGWRYVSVGGVGDTDAHRDFFARLQALAEGGGARLVPNAGRGELKSLYERASIFWHAAGYGEDEEARPIFVEHFGISTVEAMAAGCVPVVINKGGQREIVEHGTSGFVWDTLDELKAHTARLMGDESLRLRMSEAARERARAFSREAFLEKFMRLLRAGSL
jgi:glycosyltransferase involved in cell wall biosynthesis